MAATTVHVEGISSKTSEKDVRDFFSFCGKISSLSVSPGANDCQNANVTFEKESAAKTALLLDNTQLGPSQVKVTSSSGGNSSDSKSGALSPEAHRDENEVSQDDKPRSRIIAEYLAHGYVISDKAIERAIALDQTHGISTRFTTALKAFDDKVKATDKAAAVDARLGVTEKATASWRGMNSYFEKALGTPTGQKLRKFYEDGNKQVVDVHNEARHLANLKSGKPGTNLVAEKMPGSEKTQCGCAAQSGVCPCKAGSCGCNGCAKNDEVKSPVSAEAAELKKLENGRTNCNCQGNQEKCACKAGECACASCVKNPEVSNTEKAAEGKTSCNCKGDKSNCTCKAGECSCSS